jgi:hypothetical protein
MSSLGYGPLVEYLVRAYYFVSLARHRLVLHAPAKRWLNPNGVTAERRVLWLVRVGWQRFWLRLGWGKPAAANVVAHDIRERGHRCADTAHDAFVMKLFQTRYLFVPFGHG